MGDINVVDLSACLRRVRDCVQLGDPWVHLRLCLSCSYVGCWDDSKNRHATAHYQTVWHPIIQSFGPGEAWRWCYEDQALGYGRLPIGETSIPEFGD